eukprot:TRINITY_DN8810_c0_g1_i1.p1 TRINITY_DN8810_c0_g1~~TRINITY_DN8810_c0_g1_i1.p1  ORF type:complete len:176 (-),score=23.30 TRINITY_DN8810_c0_g1_i1:531-1058(-)
MDTSLRFWSDEEGLVIYAKETFASDPEPNVSLHFRGHVNTVTRKLGGTLAFRKKLLPKRLTKFEVGATMDLGSRAVSYDVEVKQSLELSSSGQRSLDLKGEYKYTPSMSSSKVKGTLELCQNVFNFTDSQDLKLKLGCNLVSQRPFVSVRENNWTLNVEFGRNPRIASWHVFYDL